MVMGEDIKVDNYNENLSLPFEVGDGAIKQQSNLDNENRIEIDSVLIRCKHCFNLNHSRVEEENILSDKKTWAMFCGCFGSCYAMYSIISGQNYYGFMKYTHYCQSCNQIIGIYEPKTSSKMKIMLIIFISVIITLKIIVFVILVVPNL